MTIVGILLAVAAGILVAVAARSAIPLLQDWRDRRRHPKLFLDPLSGNYAVPCWFSRQMWLAATRGGLKVGSTSMRLLPRVDGTFDLHLIPEEHTGAQQLLARPIVEASLELLQAVENSDEALVTDEILEQARKLRRVMQPLIG